MKSSTPLNTNWPRIKTQFRSTAAAPVATNAPGPAPPPVLPPAPMPELAHEEPVPAAPPLAPAMPTPLPEPAPPQAPTSRRLYGSEEAAAAIEAAVECELTQTWADPQRSTPWRWEQCQEVARGKYIDALLDIQQKWPRVARCCDDFWFGGCMHGVPCEDCRVRHGRPNALKAPYPWVVHTGFVEGTFCDHHMQFDRAHWMLAGPSTPAGSRRQYTGPQSSLDMILRAKERREAFCGR